MKNAQLNIADLTIDRACIKPFGSNLLRPESVLVTNQGVVVSDARGGIVRLYDGKQDHIGAGVFANSLPNGLAYLGNSSVICADFARGELYEITFDGNFRYILAALDGQKLGRVNHVCAEAGGRLWVTVSTRAEIWLESVNNHTNDGYIIVIDEDGPRIVADHLFFPNECRVDRDGRFLYVAETTKKRVLRYPIRRNGTLGEGSTFGPESLGAGLTEGLAFDAFGNLWVAMTCADRIVAITPEGDCHEILSDAAPHATMQMEAILSSGVNVPADVLLACGSPETNLITSIAFGGEDSGTVFLGNLKGTALATFRNPLNGKS